MYDSSFLDSIHMTPLLALTQGFVSFTYTEEEHNYLQRAVYPIGTCFEVQNDDLVLLPILSLYLCAHHLIVCKRYRPLDPSSTPRWSWAIRLFLLPGGYAINNKTLICFLSIAHDLIRCFVSPGVAPLLALAAMLRTRSRTCSAMIWLRLRAPSARSLRSIRVRRYPQQNMYRLSSCLSGPPVARPSPRSTFLRMAGMCHMQLLSTAVL